MNNIEHETDNGTTKKYLALLSLISRMESRLVWAELIYLSLDIAIFLFIVNLASSLTGEDFFALTNIDLFFIFMCLVVGIFLNVYWVSSVMRIQLKLKLRYFQVRFLERKLNRIGECILSDEALFFNPDVRRLESPDNKETLAYPVSGLIRMDGFIGAAKPRFFSWLMPCVFITVYFVMFFVILLNG